MIDPASEYGRKLERIADAGPAGLPIAEVGAGTALHMRMLGLAVIHDERSRVVATGQGVARAQEGAWR